MAQIISGKEVSQSVREKVAKSAAELTAKGKKPGLAVIIVGEDPASKVYVANKKKACAEVGFYSEEYALPEKTEMKDLLELIDVLN
ncbi:MAG: tetrahydrofolate dehydrogenase/cyclohydrolase catalytic domain-containing protein, partial [Acutalibacteraceae bacterium]|nr:tetrahydrofolate dehydrogenase/cyclohydrolase catalytic domain-containing protein [Acutalibacteraceae bacterium]